MANPVNHQQSLDKLGTDVKPRADSRYTMVQSSRARPKLTGTETFDCAKVLEAFHVKDYDVLGSHCTRLSVMARMGNEKIIELITTTQWMEDVCIVLRESSASVRTSVLLCLSVVFPMMAEKQREFIDGDICFILGELLEQTDLEVASAAITLIGSMVRANDYARDLCIACGLHEVLIVFAERGGQSDSLSALSCRVLAGLVASREYLDPDTIIWIVRRSKGLLNIEGSTARRNILEFFLSLAGKMPSILVEFCELGMHSRFLEFVSEPLLRGIALELIALTIEVCPKRIPELIKNGLLDRTRGLLDVEASAVFWIWSVLVEKTAGSICHDFKVSELGMAANLISGFGLEERNREACYFVATAILFHDARIIDGKVLTELAACLGTESDAVNNRVLDALMGIAKSASSDTPRAVGVDWTVISERISLVAGSDDEVLARKATHLNAVVQAIPARG